MRDSMIIINVLEGDEHQPNISNITNQAEFYHLKKVEEETVENIAEFEHAISSGGYDYFVLIGHGDEMCFTDNKLFEIEWSEIGEKICNAGCLNDNSILMMYCCKGGVMEVAFTLFAECKHLAYVFGSKEEMYPIELAIGFNLFMYQLEFKDLSPELAARKALEGTDRLFTCYFRNDVLKNPHWHNNYCKDCASAERGYGEISDCPDCP